MSHMGGYDYCPLSWATFYPRDWLTDTRDLEPAERGLYIDILCAIYNAGGPVEYDETYLCRLAGYRNVRSLRRDLGPLLAKEKLRVMEDDDGAEWLMNNRAEGEIDKARARQEKQKAKDGEGNSSTDDGGNSGNGSGDKNNPRNNGRKKRAKGGEKSPKTGGKTEQNQDDNSDNPEPPPAPRTDSTVLPLQGKDGESPSPPGAAALPDGAPHRTAGEERRWQDIWETVLEHMRGQGVSQSDIGAWVTPLRLREEEDGVWHFGAPTRLIRDYADEHFAARIFEGLRAQDVHVNDIVIHTGV